MMKTRPSQVAFNSQRFNFELEAVTFSSRERSNFFSSVSRDLAQVRISYHGKHFQFLFSLFVRRALNVKWLSAETYIFICLSKFRFLIWHHNLTLRIRYKYLKYTKIVFFFFFFFKHRNHRNSRNIRVNNIESVITWPQIRVKAYWIPSPHHVNRDVCLVVWRSSN